MSHDDDRDRSLERSDSDPHQRNRRLLLREQRGCPMRGKDGTGTLVACALKADHDGHCQNQRGEFITTGAPMTPAQRLDFMRSGGWR
jgi:hypothetical protein